MAYADPLNPATPGDLDIAGQGDDKIREMKRALIQRLQTLIQNIDNDPLQFIAGVIPTAAIADSAITKVKMADDSVGTLELIDEEVTEPKLADDSVSTRTIIDENVTEPKLADNAGSTRVLADDAVTTPKVLDENITEPKMADDAVSTRVLQDASVTAAKLAAGIMNSDSVTMLRASRILSQAEAEIAGDSYEEYDITMVGAKVGYPVHVERTSTEPYPTTGAAPGAGGWLALSQMPAHGFCIAVDKIRVHVSNRTGGLTGPVGGCTMKVTQFQYADGH